MHLKRLLRKVVLLLIALPAVLFVSGYLLTLGHYPVPATVADDPSLPVIEAKGYRFHGESFGNPARPVVVVVHGGPGWDYRSLLPLKALADEYRVVFYDQRGSGLSPRVPGAQLTLDSSLADLDAIVDTLRGGGQVSLIGHSWGAMLVTAYLGRHPEKVSHAVLAEPGFLTREGFERAGLRLGPYWDAGYLLTVTQRWFESLHIDGPDSEAASDYFLGEAASRANPEYYCNGELTGVVLQRWRAGATAMGSVLAGGFDEAGRWQLDLTRGLERFDRPVLLLASECNRLIGVEQQRYQARYFNAVRLEVIPNSGHMMFAEQPERSLAVVREYLAAQP